MSEIRVIIKEGGKIRSGITHGGVASRLFASLTSNPKNWEELNKWWSHRYYSGRPFEELIDWDKVPKTEPHDAGRLIIDFDEKAVISEQGYFQPCRVGFEYYHPEAPGTGLSYAHYPYKIPSEWKVIHEGNIITDDEVCILPKFEIYEKITGKLETVISKDEAKKISWWDEISSLGKERSKEKLEKSS